MRFFLAAILLSLSAHASAKVVSETIFFLEDDGRNYLVQRSMHTKYTGHRFHVDKHITRDDLRHVSPKNFKWDDSDPDVNTLIFNASGFTLIYPGEFPQSQLKTNDDGSLSYTSWDGERDEKGRYGFWFAPENYDRFVYSWIFPEDVEIIKYKANRKGTWIQRGNAVSYYGEQVNNLVFDIQYKVPPKPEPVKEIVTKTEIKEVVKVVTKEVPKEVIKVVTKEVEVPKEVIKVVTKEVEVPKEVIKVVTKEVPKEVIKEVVKEVPKEVIKVVTKEIYVDSKPKADNDGDGVPDVSDTCPDTPARAMVTIDGCALDFDKDGIINEHDQCPSSPPNTVVNKQGCKASSHADSDKDSVVDEFDLCPGTPRGAYVDRTGCSSDTDKDEVPDGLDKCLATPEETRVDKDGCAVSSTVEAH